MKNKIIAKFVELNVNENGLVNLVLDFPQDQTLTKVDFHISELRDWLYEKETSIGENDEIKLKIGTDFWQHKVIKITPENLTPFEEKNSYIYEDDEAFFVDFLGLDIE